MATMTCTKCQATVPSDNFQLHELRCSGPKLAGSPAASPSPANEASVLSDPPSCTEIVDALTWARTRPNEVAEVLRQRLSQYKGLQHYPPERKGRCIVTKEGTKAVEEAIAFVSRLEPMGGFGSISEPGLALAGEDHIADVGQTGCASHDSSDGCSAAERVRRYGSFSLFGECLWYGSECADARTIVLDLIVDDGVPSRGHRKGVFNCDYDSVGVAYGAHVTFSRMAAMEFAREWQPNEMFIRSRLQTGPIKIAEQFTANAKATAATQWALGACPICNEQIKGGRVIEVSQLGGKLHADCFKCGGCSTNLSGVAFKVQAGAPYCNSCFSEKFGERCTACNEVITGGTMKCALGTFHVECVICGTCGKAIGKNQFSTSSGAFACQDCAITNATTKTAVSAGRPRNISTRASPVLSSVGNAISGNGNGAMIKAKPGPVVPKAKAKTKAKVSMSSAKATLTGMGMSYADLA